MLLTALKMRVGSNGQKTIIATFSSTSGPFQEIVFDTNLEVGHIFSTCWFLCLKGFDPSKFFFKDKSLFEILHYLLNYRHPTDISYSTRAIMCVEDHITRVAAAYDADTNFNDVWRHIKSVYDFYDALLKEPKHV